MDDKPLDDLTRALLSRIDGAPPFPEGEIRSRLRATLNRPRRRPWRHAAAAAACVLLFAGGVAIGRYSAGASAGGVSPASNDVPVTIQAEGTEYVAAVTRFAERADELTPDQRSQARDASLAVMYGAAWELLRYEPEDPVATQVYELVSDERSSEGAEVVSF